MKVRTNIENINSRYIVQFDLYDFTAHEEELMQQFGEPIMNIGGYFQGEVRRDDTVPYTMVSFTLPNKHRRIASDFPITQVFDLNDDTQSDLYAQLYAVELRSRIQSIKTTLLSKHSAFIGETINTI